MICGPISSFIENKSSGPSFVLNASLFAIFLHFGRSEMLTFSAFSSFPLFFCVRQTICKQSNDTLEGAKSPRGLDHVERRLRGWIPGSGRKRPPADSQPFTGLENPPPPPPPGGVPFAQERSWSTSKSWWLPSSPSSPPPVAR